MKDKVVADILNKFSGVVLVIDFGIENDFEIKKYGDVDILVVLDFFTESEEEIRKKILLVQNSFPLKVPLSLHVIKVDELNGGMRALIASGMYDFHSMDMYRIARGNELFRATGCEIRIPMISIDDALVGIVPLWLFCE